MNAETTSNRSSLTSHELLSHRAIPAVRINPFASIGNKVIRVGEAFERFGDVVRLKGLGIRAFCFRNPDDVRHIFRTQTYKSMFVVSRVKKAIGSGVFAQRGGDEWKSKRRVVSNAFPKSEDPLIKLAAIVPCLNALEQRWRSAAGRGTALDLGKELTQLISDYTFKSFFSVDVGKRADEAGAAFHYLFEHFMYPVPLWVPTTVNREFKRSAQALRNIMREVVAQRGAPKETDNDVLAVLLANSTNEEAVDQMVSIFSGVSVLIGSLVWMFYLLSRSDQAQQKLVSEIDQVVGPRPVTLGDLANLKYPKMVFDETLRLRPSAWMLPRVCQTPFQVNRYVIPANSYLLPVIYFLHRHPRYWDSPESFTPERFASDYDASAFCPYGCGPRMCPGASLAPLIAQYVLVRIYQGFSLSSPPAAPPIEPRFTLELTTSDRVVMQIKERAIERVTGTAVFQACT